MQLDANGTIPSNDSNLQQGGTMCNESKNKDAMIKLSSTLLTLEMAVKTLTEVKAMLATGDSAESISAAIDVTLERVGLMLKANDLTK